MKITFEPYLAWILNKKQDEETYCIFMEDFEDLINIPQWSEKYSSITDDPPKINRTDLEALQTVVNWVSNRLWPDRFEDLEKSFINFKNIAYDLCRIFMKHAIEFRGDTLVTRSFYKDVDYYSDSKRHEELWEEYYLHTSLIQELGHELTRAGNQIITTFRKYIMASYRTREGLLQITTYIHPPMYTSRNEISLYPGIESFLDELFNRDITLRDCRKIAKTVIQ